MGRARKDFCNQMAASKWDWVLLAALIGLFAGIEYAVKPNKWYMAPQDYETVMYPFVEDTVPSWSVPIIALIPMVLVLVAAIFPRMLGSLKTRELHDLVYAILISIAITGSVTSLLKVAVGRPRPDFLERCFPGVEGADLQMKIKTAGGHPKCDGDEKEVLDGMKSFPSGHASWAMCSMAFTTLFLLGKLRTFERGEVWRLVVSFLPLGGGLAVGVTRILDYRHHWTDVAAGSILGMATAFAVYSMYYPRPWGRRGTELPLYLSQEPKGLPLTVPGLSQGTCTLGTIRSLRPTETNLSTASAGFDNLTQSD